MSYSVFDFSESLNRLNQHEHGFTKADVAECLAAWGDRGDYDEWTGGFLLRLRDGHFAYLSGWCDTTGWGCQDGISVLVRDHSLADCDFAQAHDRWDKIPSRLQWDNNPADLNRFIRGEIDDLYEPSEL